MKFFNFSVFCFSFFISVLVHAQDCNTAVLRVQNKCHHSAREIKEVEKDLTRIAGRIPSLKGVAAYTTAKNELGDTLKTLKDVEEDAKKCTEEAEKKCTLQCTGADASKCKDASKDGDKEKYDKTKEQLEATQKKLETAEKDSTNGGGGDKNKKDGDKKDGGGDKKGGGDGGGGGMPQMPQQPEEKPTDTSCGGATPGPGCPPKDDACLKDAKSPACICDRAGAASEVCQKAYSRTEVNKGGKKESVLSEDGGGARTNPSDRSSSDVDSNGKRKSSGGDTSMMHSGGGSGLHGLGSGGVTTPSKGDDPAQFASSGMGSTAGGGVGSGYSGGSSGGSSKSSSSQERFEGLAAKGAIAAHRRLSGVSNDQIAKSHENLFENISRAYRLNARKLTK